MKSVSPVNTIPALIPLDCEEAVVLGTNRLTELKRAAGLNEPLQLTPTETAETVVELLGYLRMVQSEVFGRLGSEPAPFKDHDRACELSAFMNMSISMLENFSRNLEQQLVDAQLFRLWVKLAHEQPTKTAKALMNCKTKEDYAIALAKLAADPDLVPSPWGA